MKALVCEKRGYLWLTTKNGRLLGTKTVCKTWGCRACAPHVLAFAVMKMEFGILMSGRCWLITVTYRRWTKRTTVDAVCAAKDFKRFIQLFKLSHPNLAWLKIPELTRKGMVHLHCLMSGLRDDVVESDMTDEVSRLWKEVTGDSWIVDARKVHTPKRMARYLGKYLAKGFEVRAQLEALGFRRRYSSSINWPKPKRIMLRGTEENRWFHMMRTDEKLGPKYAAILEASQDDYLLERVGDDLVLILYADAEKYVQRSTLERWMNGNKD